ncbi:pyridoxamine 5'-phosphate oxidase family protein [Antarctobacter sp.]|uniref:pyridoxamine 5'-phosphate oxidase family protein n=1 Tax=Antarctobacter sp. TaxID=1872577 RepID=UPI003A94E410
MNVPDPDESRHLVHHRQGHGGGSRRVRRQRTSFHVADSKAHLYANVFGTLTLVNDGETGRIWNAVAAAWFEDGRKDSSISW